MVALTPLLASLSLMATALAVPNHAIASSELSTRQFIDGGCSGWCVCSIFGCYNVGSKEANVTDIAQAAADKTNGAVTAEQVVNAVSNSNTLQARQFIDGGCSGWCVCSIYGCYNVGK